MNPGSPRPDRSLSARCAVEPRRGAFGPAVRSARVAAPVPARTAVAASAALAIGIVAIVLTAASPARAAREKPRAETPPTVRVSVDTGGPTTRVVLTAPADVSSAVAEARGRVEVVYSDPVEFSPHEGRVGDAIVASWESKGDRTIVFSTGPGFRRFETFNLKNPTRLVLDFEGVRAARSGAGRDRRADARPRSVIVIDPGHGGVETGAIGPTGLEEKDVALDLARRLKSKLQEDPALGVVLTRDDDRLVPLDERTAIANHNRADLFISIHMNAAKRRQAFGAETYFLSPEATDDEARTLAALENRTYDPSAAPAPPPPDSPDAGLELILWDLAQNVYLAESAKLAESVQAEMNALAGTRNRGVRQAPFRVLMGATMPAILVEVGFISNPEEEARFRTDEHRERVVEAITRAVREFRRTLTRLDGPEPDADGGMP